MWHGIPEYLALAAVVAIVAHACIRRFVVACLVAAAVASLLNLLHEAWLVGFEVNLAWGPILFFEGNLLALPVAGLVGLFFKLRRRNDHSSQIAEPGETMQPPS